MHGLPTPIGQRVVGIGLGYEDISDHDDLRHDPVLCLLADRLGPKRADCAVLAGKSTLNRLEHAPASLPGRYHKIGSKRICFDNTTPTISAVSSVCARAASAIDRDLKVFNAHFAKSGVIPLPLLMRRGLALDCLGWVGFLAIAIGGGASFILLIMGALMFHKNHK